MTWSNIISIVAILLAPAVAIYVGKYLDKKKEILDAKLWIFRTLMATRATPMSQEHVKALNMIDVTFYGKDKKSKGVVESWNILRDHFHKDLEKISDDLLQKWNEENQDLLIELLQKMADYLNYYFDKTAIKNTSYFPKGYGEQESDLMLIRKGFVNMMLGKFSMPIEVKFAQAGEEGKKFQESFKNYFEGKTRRNNKYRCSAFLHTMSYR